MEPNPNKFPVLSYVLSRINPNIPLIGRIPSFDSPPDDCDIERPPSVNPHEWPEPPLFEQMPQLRDPDLISSMKAAVADVAQTRAVLQTLGDRPDHETVDNARLSLAEIEASLANQLQEIVLSPRPDGLDRLEWRAKQSEKEQECRSATEKAKSMYKAVIALEEMHDSYEKLLKDAEERLVKIYRSSEGKIGVEEDRTAEEDDQVNEEVVGILQEAMGKGLERVELSGRQLRLIPEAFGRLHSLVVLNLSNNHLEGLPDSIAALGHLEELRVSSNILVSLPDSIGLLFKLKILDVSGNKLTALPNSVSQCRSLVELDASYNKIAYLPTYIGFELVNLQRLCVHLNKLRSLPTSICEMRSLRHLDAHFNELRGLPDTIGRLTNLEFLDLSSNFSDLTELPDTIGDLINLKELNLSNNQIYALPVTFGRLKDLSKLNLDQNPLIDPPMEVVKNGIDFVKNYMSKRLLDVLQEEEDRRTREANTESSQGGGWLTRSTSWLNNFVSGVSESVGGLVGGSGGRSFKDPFLDQQL